MAYQALGLGTTEGDGTGDTLRLGGDKVNDNFVEIYTLLGTGSALTSGISASSSVVTLAGPTITGVASFADGSVSAPSTGTVEPAGDTAAGDNAAIGYTSTEGLILTGQGSTNDVTIKNDADADVIEIPTGTTNVTVAGTLGTGGLITSGAGIVIANAGNIGAIAIASNGVVTFSQIPVLPANSILIANLVDDSITEAKMANDSISSVELKTLSTLLIKNSGGTTLATFHTAGA